MNYINLNEQAHSECRGLVDKIKSSTGKTKENNFIKLYAKLAGHHQAEEEIVFPEVLAAAEKEDDIDCCREMPEEHSLIMFQLGVLNNTPLDNETWDAKFSVFEEISSHHMDEEEEDFADIAEKLLSEEKLKELGDAMEPVMKNYEDQWLEKLKK